AKEPLPARPHESFEVREKRLEKPELGRLAVRAARPRRQVDADDGNLREIRLQVATLDVEFPADYAGCDARGRLGIQRHAAVAPALGRMEGRVRLARGE